MSVGIILCVCISVSFASNKMPHSFVDKYIGDLLVGKDRIEKIVQLYGQGFSQKNFHGETLCYHNAREQIDFRLSFHDGLLESVTISKTQDQETPEECKGKSIESKHLITGKGIQLGDTQKKVIDVYGKPGKRETKDGVLIFEYHTDYTEDPQVALFYDAYLYFIDDKLIKLVIHDGE
jgi:hypothetical protein